MTMTRLDVREQVLMCEGCELHAKGKGPVPFTGPTPAYVAVVGEAPGRDEDRLGKPFIGPAGQMLRKALSHAGFVVDELFIANAVSCFPDRTPTSGEVNACSGNLAAQLEVADPAWVLLLGGVALSTLRSDVKISKARGHVFVPDPDGRRRYFATYHPSYALRNVAAERVMKEDLVRFKEMTLAEPVAPLVPNWLPYASDDCLGCGISDDEMGEHDEPIRFDEMGGSWCERCWRKHTAEGKAQVKDEKRTERVQVKTGHLFE